MNKASEDDGILAEICQILKDDAIKVLYSTCHQIWIAHSGHRNGKDQFLFQSQRQCQRMLKLPHNCTRLTRLQSNVQNSPSQASTLHEPSTSRCSSWF